MAKTKGVGMRTNRGKKFGVIRNLAVVFSFCIPISCWSACTKEERNQFNVNGDWLSTYSSIEGNKSDAAAMTISMTREKMDAVLFDPSVNGNVVLSGNISDNGHFSLTGTRTENSSQEIKIEGFFLETDPRGTGGKLNCDAISLKMVSAEETKSLLLAIEHANSGKIENRYREAGSTNDSVFEENAIRFARAIRSNDRKTVSNLMIYPLRVDFMRGNVIAHRMVRTPKELIEQFDKVFSQSVINGISSSRPYHMDVSKYGFAILGYGYVGFAKEGKVAYVLSYLN